MDPWATVLNFDGINGFVSLNKPFPALPNGVTVEFWALGADSLPRYNSIFETHDAGGTRVLNIHLPWNNEVVYWDAGPAGPLERIEKGAQAAEYKGKWTHWAFIKDVARGEMAILRDGALWHEGTGRPKPIPESSRSCIGSSLDPNFKWSGRLAEFRIWDRPRSVAEVRADRCRRLSGQEHGLIACWPLNHIDADGTTPDLVGVHPGKVQGAATAEDATLTLEVRKAQAAEPTVTPSTTAAPTANHEGPKTMQPENSSSMKPNANDMKTVLDGVIAGLAAGPKAGDVAPAGSDLTKVGYNSGYALSYGFLNGLLDGVGAVSSRTEAPSASDSLPTERDADAIRVRSNTGVPASFLHRDLLVCCGEDREEMLHAVRAVLPDPVPSYRYRCYEFWRYPSFTLVLTGIGTGCLEPMLWEVMDAKTLGDKAAKRLILFGTAGYLSGTQERACGKVFLVEGAYPAGCAVRLDPADLPVRPRFKGLDKLPNPRAEEISTDHYYAFSPSTEAHKMIAKKYDKSLQEGVTAQWKDNRLIAMETGQFYHFCRCYGDDETQFVAFRGVANLADQFEDQGTHAVNVLTEGFRQAVQLLK